MIKYLLISIPIFIQAGYDYAGWYGIFKEQSGHALEWLYRTVKAVLDYPVTLWVLIAGFGWDIDLVAALYVLKQFGWCDAVYIAIWKVFHPKDNYTAEGIWWLWWTPLGLHRSEIVYRPDDPHTNVNEWLHLYKNIWLKKGIMTLKEFYLQLGAGMVAGAGIYYFKAVTWMWYHIVEISKMIF